MRSCQLYQIICFSRIYFVNLQCLSESKNTIVRQNGKNSRFFEKTRYTKDTMFDTIHLRVENLKIHEQIYRMLIKQKTTSKAYDLNSKNPVEKHTTFLSRDILFMETTGKAVEKFRAAVMMARNKIASSHYKLIIFVDIKDDCINFNFSIPKYFFGTNIFQAVPHQGEEDYRLVPDDLAYNAKIAYKRLRMYVRAFFAKQFPGCAVDFSYVQLKRFDLCFNLLFDSKMSALDYLEHQRSIDKKHLRAKNPTSNNYMTSIFYSNKKYSCKIYHKGSEFQKNDRKELDKINRQAMGGYGSARFDVSKKIFDTEALQDVADRTLRFEMTFRSAFISEIFNTKVLKIGVQNYEFERLKKVYDEIYAISVRTRTVLELDGSIMMRDKKVVKVPVGMGHEQYEYYKDCIKRYYDEFSQKTGQSLFDLLADVGGVKMVKENENYYMKVIRSFHHAFNNFLSKSHKIYLRNDYEDKGLYREYLYYGGDLKHLHYIKFSSTLLMSCFDKFYDFVQDFKLRDVPDVTQFKASMTLVNAAKKNSKYRTDEKMALLIYALMKKGYNLKMIRSMLEMQKASYYRYKKFFEDCGVTKQSALKIYKPEYSHHAYYREVYKNNFRKYLDFKFI